MNDYQKGILDGLFTELAETEGQELPWETVKHLDLHLGNLKPVLEYPMYLNCELGHLNLVLGFGDDDPEYWNGTIYAYIHNADETEFYQIEIRNGSPRYVLWELFNELNEQIKERLEK
jgi:hypothetical protein